MGIENIWQLIGNIIIGFGVFCMIFGAVSLFVLKDFYPRILVASKIDTVGLLSFVIGFAFRHGLSFFTGKLFIILIIMLVLNPFVAHILARSAYRSGHELAAEAEEGEKS
ncbi:MAG: monovalent cation/H(+) antiporter subunit G [Defluviitaleaceae bacterium]|nr:monovalent cation/H(+) antiporter subunit G [Defluviitaleaceae bacterium]MCL2239233.1 monovalent cation/H(+) antiporter subunit G [Defluviitaleaceae bacterium]MCL2239813.1 monovalent cation/H(+) antiporter subunit G [Defluviitaleaceae bacterium]